MRSAGAAIGRLSTRVHPSVFAATSSRSTRSRVTSPGARSLPFAGNLRDGKFLPPEELRRRFVDALDGVPMERAVAYCGSGVTACHHVLAAAQAGGSRAFACIPASWSEWIANGERPVAKGG